MFQRLREDIDCILERDPAARSRWEVLTCYPGLHALLHPALGPQGLEGDSGSGWAASCRTWAAS